MTMPRSEDEPAEALAQSEAWLGAVNPDEVSVDAIEDRKDLRQIGVALISVETAEQALVSAVANARANKRSWTDIANVLGVSRQAARQRFGDRVAACLSHTHAGT
jgi:IMP cyclohydrolase